MSTHAITQPLLPLDEPAPEGRTFVNASLWFVDSDGYRVVFHRYEPMYRAALTDEVHLRWIAVALRQSRLAAQVEIARAVGHDVSTQACWERQYAKDSINGLMPKKRTGRPGELDRSQETFVRKWFHAGQSNRAMAKRLSVDEATIRRTLKRLGLVRQPALPARTLPTIEDATGDATSVVTASDPATEPEGADDASVETLPPADVRSESPSEGNGQAVSVPSERSAARPLTLDHDPHDRRCDRALARLGLLDHAAPRFAEADCGPRARVLLAVPLLVSHGRIEAFVQVYGSLYPSFYGLRTTRTASATGFSNGPAHCSTAPRPTPATVSRMQPSRSKEQICEWTLCEPTARRYRRMGRLLSAAKQGRAWRTRLDPFADVWPQVEEQLRAARERKAKTLFEWLQGEYPGRFSAAQLRTRQRQVRRWRALSGPTKEVFFDQVHRPGELCASDFTHLGELRVTIAGGPFDHLLYHFVLTYSNWESVTICHSESAQEQPRLRPLPACRLESFRKLRVPSIPMA